LREEYSTVGLDCTKIIWQQIFKSSLEVTAVGVLLHVSVERRHLRRKCIKTVTVDSGKTFQFRERHFFAKFEKFATQ